MDFFLENWIWTDLIKKLIEKNPKSQLNKFDIKNLHIGQLSGCKKYNRSWVLFTAVFLLVLQFL